MPRKDTCAEAETIVADTRDEIAEIIRERVIPFYDRPLKLLAALVEGKRDSFYYWNEDK